MKTQSWKLCLTLLTVALIALCDSTQADENAAATRWLEGELLLAWATPEAGTQAPVVMAAVLRRDDGSITDLALDPAQLAAIGGPMAATGARVRTLVADPAPDAPAATVIEVQRLPGDDAAPEASGSYPYASLMCKFADVGLPPEGLSYFQGMYGATWPGLDHYWRRQSYGQVDVVGSTAAGWFTLPHTQQYYIDLSAGGNYSPMLTALYDDCTSAASGSVNVNNYEGVNLMFNDTFGPYAWGGWGGVTWEPPWGWRNVGVIGHEMGHAFGLPHSNNADGDGDPYDNPWDVMSDTWNYAVHDGTYGTVGKHTISYHKNALGWIAPAAKAEVSSAGVFHFSIDHLTLETTSNLRMVTVPIAGTNRWYTVEVRDQVSYDGNLPGFAVIIHEVNPSRSEPAWLVDADNPSNGGDAGAMWLPGECFDDTPNEIRICVESVTTEGYVVEVAYGDWFGIFSDRFESGDVSAWSAAN
ncbi:MAG: hypothetical protein PVG53_07105 [Holophagae bacterium]|jgi:hypothetical protein